METMQGIPLTQAFKVEKLIPLDKVNPPQDLLEFLDGILVTAYEDESFPDSDGGRFEVTLSTVEPAVLEIPAIDGFALVFGGQGGNLLTIGVEMRDNDYSLKLGGGLRIRISRSILKPVIRSDGEWADDPVNAYAYIPLTVAMLIDSNWNISFDGTNEFNIGPAMIGDSGFVIEGSLTFDFSETTSLPETLALGLGDSWQGAIFKSLTLHLPQSLEVPILPSDLTLTNFHMGTGGISGTITGNWTPSINGLNISGNGAGELFGISFGLKSLSVSLVQNSFTAFELRGALGLPFFEKAIDVTLSIDHEGNINIAIDSPTGLAELTIPDVLKMELSAIEFEIEEGVFAVKIGGKLTPLLAGIDWPSFDIEELSIDSEGNVKIEGGWINLPDQYSIDFFGFQLEITQLGFGSNDDQSKWLGFSGGLKLIDGFQAGASVEGLRITWGNGDPKVSFNGIGVEFEVPNAVRFKGAVSFREFEQVNQGTGLTEQVRRFDGEIKLELLALNFTVNANLVIGSAENPDGSSYNFFAIFLGAELPAGIPLFNTGLALYGLAGLFALQMEPNKTADEPWYGIGDGEGWYKKPEIGVTDLKNKWTNVPDSFALGAGITIGTLPDNGFTFSGKFLLVLVIPGPIIMLEGKANMLKQRSELDEEPIFRSIAVLDGREGSFLFGLDAQYKFGSGGELIEIGGGVEAFFSFSDPMAWHLYIGLKEPREKRIRAEIFQLFEANAYFMLDAYKLAMGAWVGYDKKWTFGPLKVAFEAWLEHNVVLSWNPVFLYGDIWAHGKAELSVFGFGIGLSIDAKLAGQVFDPFWIKGEFEVGINLPWPLPDFSVDISVEWGPKKVAPEIPAPLKETALEHLKVSSSWEGLLLGEAVNTEGTPNDIPADFNIPVVPLDVRPQITFGKSVHDINQIGVNIFDPSPEFEVIGDAEKNEGAVEVKYYVENTVLQKFEGGTYVDVAGKNLINIPDIFGAWAPEPKRPDGADPADLKINQSKLLVWSKTPYDYNRQINKTWDEWFEDTFSNYPCPSLPDEKEYCYDFENIPLDQFFTMIFQHPENEKLVLFWLSPTFQTVETLPVPLSEKNKAFCFPGNNSSEFIQLDNNLVILAFPEAVRKVKLCLRSSDEVLIQVLGIDTNGELVPLGDFIPAGAGQGEEIFIERSSNEIVALRFQGRFCLSCICFTVGVSAEATEKHAEVLSHLNSEMARWADEGSILEPFSRYRLKIISGYESKAKDTAYAGDAAFEKTENFENYLYFRTEGPPGLVTLSPANNPTASGSGEGSDKALENLDLYVRQTIPATVPDQGEKPQLPKPVYRAYDVGVEFNEDYVELMYKIAQRDLGIYLYDNNENPVRDNNGKLLVLSNQWGATETVTLLESENRYIEQLKEADCVAIDESIIPGDSTLTSLSKQQVLTSDTVYTARLSPLLFQDHFLEDKGAWEEDTEGTIGGPANWIWATHPEIEGSGCIQNNNVLTLLGNPDLSAIDSAFDTIVIPDDLVRPTGTYRILTVDNVTKQITVDAIPQLTNPASSAWTIPEIGALIQTSNVYGTDTNAASPDKKGTVLFLKDQPSWSTDDQPSTWTNYRFTTVLHTTDNDGIGVVFRYGQPSGVKSYYRFAMNRERTYRRLVRVIGNSISILAEDNYSYDTGVDYQITVEAIEDSIKIYQNGDLIFDVQDSSIGQGSIGLYCWAQENARFNQVRVDDFRKNAAIVYQFEFTTGWYANFFHHLHSYLNESWKLQIPNNVDLNPARNAAQPTSAVAQETEFRAYDKLAQELFGASADILPSEVQVSRMIKENTTWGWWIHSPEPLLWDRLEMLFKKSPILSNVDTPPSWGKMTALHFSETETNEEYVEMLLNKSNNLNGTTIAYPGFAGVPLSQNAIVLFEDDFKYTAGLLYKEKYGANALDRYQIIDGDGAFSGPSNWSVMGNSIRQSSNIYTGDTVNPQLALGSLALIGNNNWGNIQLQVVLRSTDNDAIGFVFRYLDEDNFCRFSMDRQRGYRRIIQVKNGVLEVLWEDQFAYTLNQDHLLEISIFEKTLVAQLNHELLFAKHDSLSIESGRIGYYSWLNTGAQFEGLIVNAISENPLLYRSDFANQTYTIVDHDTAVQGPSIWEVQGSKLVQRSNIHSRGNWNRKFGTFALIDEREHYNSRIHLNLLSQDNDVLGVMFRVHTTGIDTYDYYRFSIDRQMGKRRLERKTGNSISLLWQDNFTYIQNREYPVMIQSIGSVHQIYFDGQFVTEVVDNQIASGGFALFSWGNRGAQFDQVFITNAKSTIGPWQIIDEGNLEGPSEWFANGTTFSERTNINDNDPTLAKGTLAIAGEDHWENYSLKLIVKSNDNDAFGAVFRYKDTQNYYRFSMDSQRNYRRLSKMKNGVLTILQEENEGYEVGTSYTITIKVLFDKIQVFMNGLEILSTHDNTHNTGKIGLYSWANTGISFDHVSVKTPVLEAYRLFRDAFAQNDLTDWQILDQGNRSTPSSWTTEEGTLRQTSNIHNNVTQDALNKRGTIISAGDVSWTNIVFRVTVKSLSNDEFGIVFRYIDDRNHYRFTMNNQGGYRRLTRVRNGLYHVLWQDSYAFEIGTSYQLTVLANEEHLTLYTNDILTLSIGDDSHRNGKIGLHCWASENTYFSNLGVFDINVLADSPLLEENFDTDSTLTWAIEDEVPNKISDWQIINGNFVQTTNIWGGSTNKNKIDKPGTYAICEKSIQGDFRFQLTLKNDDNDAVGVVFQYQDPENFYRFSIDHQRRYRRLVKKENGIYVKLWEDNTRGYEKEQSQAITIDYLSGNIIMYLNGIRIGETTDTSFSSGKIGLYCWASKGVHFGRIKVLSSEWKTHYRFGREEQHPDGTVFRVYSGNQNSAHSHSPSIEHRYVADSGSLGNLTFFNSVQRLRLSNSEGTILHEDSFQQENNFSNETIRVLRKRDGTAMFIFKTGNGFFTEGTRRLQLTFRKDNQVSQPESQVWKQNGNPGDEQCILDIPWVLNNS